MKHCQCMHSGNLTPRLETYRRNCCIKDRWRALWARRTYAILIFRFKMQCSVLRTKGNSHSSHYWRMYDQSTVLGSKTLLISIKSLQLDKSMEQLRSARNQEYSITTAYRNQLWLTLRRGVTTEASQCSSSLVNGHQSWPLKRDLTA